MRVRSGLGASVSRLALVAAAAILAPGLAQARAQAQPGPSAPQALAAPSAEGRMVLPDDVAPLSYAISVTPDAKALTFAGHVAITLDVKRATPTIELNAADIDFKRVRLDGGGAAPQVALDPVQQTATFTFDKPVAPGRHVLDIAYTGRVYQQASGLFALDYDTPKGKARALFTQFENSDARRFVPSFDEPGQKATFQLTVTVPDDLMAVSNMPVATTIKVPGGLKQVAFQTTPKMSSYLLFFGLGDFQRVSRMVDGVDVGVIVKKGDTDQAAFALDAASQILPYYNSYFGTKYPLPKLDLIAGPGESQFFGAMENWGAIFYFESDLLIDPKVATEDDRQNVYIVVAHEMAHQWFGDLVTMAWWDDLWLNEGFASWMENKVTDHFHPEWNVWLQAMGGEQAAMATDAKAGTHPIITPIKDVLQASNAFDEITYQKGSAVIRMLEGYTGEDAWRAGVRRYIAAHAYGNAITDDLWREMDAVSPRKVADIAHDFTLQAGVPMATVTCRGAGPNLTAGQFRVPTGPMTGRWSTPLAVANAPAYQPGQTLVLSDGAATATGCPSVVNAGQTSYARTLYTGAAATGVEGAFPHLKPADQLGLLYDMKAEGDAGDAPMADWLTLTARVPSDANPVEWSTLARQLLTLDRLYDGLPGQARFRAYAVSRLGPEMARLGWDAKPDEPTNTATERTRLLAALGRMGDPQTVAEARRRFADLVAGRALEPSVRKATLSVVAVNADATTWEQLHQLARTAPTQLQKSEYYALLGSARDPALAQKALALALSGEPEPTTAPMIIRFVSDSHPKMALDFTAAHWAQVSAMLDSSARASFVPALARGSSDPAVSRALGAFADADIPASARQDVVKVQAEIAQSAEIRAKRLPEVDRWLAAAGAMRRQTP